jgi:hypothetical protein
VATAALIKKGLQMSYTVMPTAITTGTRRLHTLGVFDGWGLGTVPDPDTEAELQAGGWDPARIQILVQLGVTNEQLLSLPYPASEDEMTAAYNALALSLAAAQAPATPTPGTPTPGTIGPSQIQRDPGMSVPNPTNIPSPSPGNFLRAGSQLSYTATWGNTAATQPGWNDPNGIQSAIQAVLSAKWGVVIDSQFHTTNDLINTTGQSGFTLQVHTTRDYGAAGDVKSIIDGALYNLGLPLKSSTISLTVTGVTPLVTGPVPGAAGSAFAMTPIPPAGATNWSSWLQSNMPFLIFALAGIVILPPLLRRR